MHSTLDAYLMERVLDEEDAESQFGEDVLRRAAGLLSARKQIIHKWDLSGLAAADLVSSVYIELHVLYISMYTSLPDSSSS
jgi:hypothetical protein